jgi:hypothetical protein
VTVALRVANDRVGSTAPPQPPRDLSRFWPIFEQCSGGAWPRSSVSLVPSSLTADESFPVNPKKSPPNPRGLSRSGQYEYLPDLPGEEVPADLGETLRLRAVRHRRHSALAWLGARPAKLHPPRAVAPWFDDEARRRFPILLDRHWRRCSKKPKIRRRRNQHSLACRLLSIRTGHG